MFIYRHDVHYYFGARQCKVIVNRNRVFLQVTTCKNKSCDTSTLSNF